jgi:ElaB/YqjD/DUF883 family membrane-anchored ribosome-binding protein
MAKKATEGSGGTREPEEIEHEIEQTREELGDTVAAVTEKADVKKQAKAKTSEAKQKATAKKDAAKEKAAETKEQITSKTQEVTPESAEAGIQRVRQLLRENPGPVMVGLAAFGGFIFGRVVGRR